MSMADGSDLSYVRQQMVLAQPAPSNQRGAVHWMRTNLFATVPDTILTFVAFLVLAYFLPFVLRWLFIDAQWT